MNDLATQLEFDLKFHYSAMYTLCSVLKMLQKDMGSKLMLMEVVMIT